ncbi:MAG: NifB/NifX family molybdenum-iron cluster-binding protein [Dehalococcoidales bacterium]|nr:NifB/NifX family molybdenum-iron cluster-binding protein [Dehalococcoidales bacterium]
MRCAVPVIGGMLSAHFGHCGQFALFDVDENRKQIVSQELVASPGHEPGALPSFLAARGVTVVIAGGMGSRAQNLFAQSGIKVVINALEKNPERAVSSYLAGTLETGNDMCDH